VGVVLVVVMIVSMAVTVIVIVVILIPAVVAFMIVIPFMVVFETTVWTIPITCIEPLAIMAWADPARTFIGRPAPIACMPAIMSGNRIPVAANPDEFGSGLRRNDGDNARLGRSAKADAHRELCAGWDAY
jgi:hypothetical protein